MSSTSNEQRLQEDEYEKQYFGFSSSELSDDLSEGVKAKLKEALSKIEHTFLEENFDAVTIKEQLKSLEDLYLQRIAAPLEKFREAAREVFRIPPNVPLELDTVCHKENYTSEEVCALTEEVEALEKTFLREKHFLHLCKLEKDKMEKLKPLQEAMNVKLKTVPSLIKSKERLEKDVHLTKLVDEYLNFCSEEETSSNLEYYKFKNIVTLK